MQIIIREMQISDAESISRLLVKLGYTLSLPPAKYRENTFKTWGAVKTALY